MKETLDEQLATKQADIRERLVTVESTWVDDHLSLLTQSDWLIEQLARHPQWCNDLNNGIVLSEDFQFYYDRLWSTLNELDSKDEALFLRTLRHFRCYYAVAIYWQSLLSVDPERDNTQQVLEQQSALAEGILVACRDYLYRECCHLWGTPYNDQQQEQPLVILGMGKLGGGELNFSSDVDLIFTYPEAGMTKNGRRAMENSTFFARLGQRLIHALDTPTEDGFVYRVDMRLRPLGDGGPLVLSYSEMEDYYQAQGRDWERYAMVKAKVLGDQSPPYVQTFYTLIKPFVYRRYIDFSVLNSLRTMKAMIEKEVRRRQLHHNIKLGAGGIREVEFIAQVFQLIRGGCVFPLQTRSLFQALNVIAQEGYLTEQEVQQLRDNMLFLRRSENMLQAFREEQTDKLPDTPLDQFRLATALYCKDWPAYERCLAEKMAFNHQVFEQLIGWDYPSEREDSVDEVFEFLWHNPLHNDEIKSAFPYLSDEDVVEWHQQLTHYHHELGQRRIGQRGRDVFDKLMPLAFSVMNDQQLTMSQIARLLNFLQQIADRTTYLELLLEYPQALHQLATLCAASKMVSEQLIHYPMLLDELIHPTALNQITPLTHYPMELRQALLRIDTSDEEAQIEALRQFKQQNLLHIAAADIHEVLPTMKVSDHLTYLAEAILHQVVHIAWRMLVARYGVPNHLQEGDQGFLIVGYGKLGGIEMGYSSDLDLVFLYDCPSDGVTLGDRSIESHQFYLRLAQRIVHLFSLKMNFGILYEIDLRLRPQGDAGLLACRLSAFQIYQESDAWIWEHQALVRARPVYGDLILKTQFEAIRSAILMTPRDLDTLKQAIYTMRQKMKQHLASTNEAQFNLKFDDGGICDIEFLSQFLVLAFSTQHPALAQWTDNVRILESAAAVHVISEKAAQTLITCYIEMRNRIHRLALQGKNPCVDRRLFDIERESVIQLFKQWISIDDEERLIEPSAFMHHPILKS